jgi:hypothetical protein
MFSNINLAKLATFHPLPFFYGPNKEIAVTTDISFLLGALIYF